MEGMKEKIFRVAISLFKENGFNEVSINEICSTCGVTKGSFYHHYNSKNDLLLNYYDLMSKDTYSIINDIVKIESAFEQLWKVFEYSIDITLELGAELLKNLIIIDIQEGNKIINPYSSGTTERNKSYFQLLYNLVEKAQKKGEIRSSVNPKDLISSYIAGLLGIASNWSATGGTYDEKKELRKLFVIIFKA